jgi:RimJ/RimL family protein N-acetyltransferase
MSAPGNRPPDPLITLRLILRPLERDDAAAVFRYRSRPEVCRYQTWLPADEGEVRRLIEDQRKAGLGAPGTWFSLAIRLRENGTLIGDTGLFFPEPDRRETEIGITLAPEYQGRGYAGETLQAVFDFAFRRLRRDAIVASVDPRNAASVRLLERSGMRRTELSPRSLVIRGEIVDDARYRLTADAFRRSGGMSPSPE